MVTHPPLQAIADDDVLMGLMTATSAATAWLVRQQQQQQAQLQQQQRQPEQYFMEGIKAETKTEFKSEPEGVKEEAGEDGNRMGLGLGYSGTGHAGSGTVLDSSTEHAASGTVLGSGTEHAASGTVLGSSTEHAASGTVLGSSTGHAGSGTVLGSGAEHAANGAEEDSQLPPVEIGEEQPLAKPSEAAAENGDGRLRGDEEDKGEGGAGGSGREVAGGGLPEGPDGDSRIKEEGGVEGGGGGCDGSTALKREDGTSGGSQGGGGDGGGIKQEGGGGSGGGIKEEGGGGGGSSGGSDDSVGRPRVIKLCTHCEPCLAPRSDPQGDSPLGRGFFKFAALDTALGILAEAQQVWVRM